MAVKKPLVLYTDTVKEIAASDSIAGAVVSGAVDNAALRADGTGGATSQGSAIVISDYTTSTQNNVQIKADDGSTADITLVLSPKGTGALTAQKPDGTATGGNARGNACVDWQMYRGNADEVAAGGYAVISGGLRNKTTGNYPVIGGGFENFITGGSAAVIGGGYGNRLSGDYSAILGGRENVISANANGNVTIIGGNYLTFSGNGHAVGFLGGSTAMTITASNAAVFGNTDLWLSNNDNAPRGIRFYSNHNASGAFPNTTKHIKLVAPSSLAADNSYTLPTAYPAADGYTLQSTTNGIMSWGVPAGGGNMLNSENLSALTDFATARANLGLSYATKAELNTGSETSKVISPEVLTGLLGNGGSVSTAPSGVATLSIGAYFSVNSAITSISDIDFDNAFIGRVVYLKFDGATTLVHNATTLVLPGGKDIVTAAGDVATFVASSAENVVCINYQRAQSSPTGVITAALASDHVTVSTHTTGTEVSLGATLAAGTYVFQFFLLAQSSATATALRFGINFTGTAAVRKFVLRYPTTGTTAANATASNEAPATTALHESTTSETFSTTAPNLGGAAVANANQNALYVIEGLIIVTATGDLELWHGSETNNATTIKEGSSLIITKIA
jgi:hypothetical protein